MTKKVLLFTPPSGLYRRDDRCQSRVEDQTVNIIFPPIDLAQLASIVREKGAVVTILDLPAMKKDWDYLKNILSDFKPEIILFNVTTATIDSDLKSAELAKNIDPKIITIAKGEYLNIFGEKILSANQYLDIIIYGEPEITFGEIYEGKKIEDINGIIYRKDDKIIRNPEREFEKNLGDFPIPARDLLYNNLYRSPETNNKITVIYASRGCPGKCLFCPASRVSGSKIRIRPPENILKEIKDCVFNHNIREFLFNGDTFTINKKWVRELCSLIVKENLKIRWGCNSRVDTIDEETLEMMKKAGCWVIAYGIESGVQELLDKMGKGATLEQARRAIEITKKVGIRTHAFYIIGLPWETEETLKQTLQFAKELDTDFFDINIAYPLPGTEYYDMAIKENLMEGNPLTLGGYADAIVRSYKLSADELIKWRKKMLWNLYLRPRYIIRTLYKAGSIRKIFLYIKAAIKRAIYLLSK